MGEVGIRESAPRPVAEGAYVVAGEGHGAGSSRPSPYAPAYSNPSASNAPANWTQRRDRGVRRGGHWRSQRTTSYRPKPCERDAPIPCCSAVSQSIAHSRSLNS